MPYIYEDEDNEAMFDPWDGIHNPTVYLSRAEMNYYEKSRPDEKEED